MLHEALLPQCFEHFSMLSGDAQRAARSLRVGLALGNALVDLGKRALEVFEPRTMFSPAVIRNWRVPGAQERSALLQHGIQALAFGACGFQRCARARERLLCARFVVPPAIEERLQ